MDPTKQATHTVELVRGIFRNRELVEPGTQLTLAAGEAFELIASGKAIIAPPRPVKTKAPAAPAGE